MSDPVREFVLKSIGRKAKIPAGIDVDAYNYVDSGHVDSIEIIKFLVDIEEKFDIEIPDADVESPEFKTIGGLVALVNRKIAAKG